ncbi:hypothetical protein GCM10023189_36600 [Nibrella saemangeumensis]|uniref:Trypsin-co-occurring domain-containing protein n=1 Tax=Nibrella saemangeumensis TaxID=1084526 RepID=A0ABP8N4N1_9BACT
MDKQKKVSELQSSESSSLLQKVKLSDGTTVLFETASPIGKKTKGLRKEVSNKGIPSIETITSTINSFSKDLHKAFDDIKPNKVSIKFGIEVSAEPGDILSLIIKGSGKSNLEITLEWESPK